MPNAANRNGFTCTKCSKSHEFSAYVYAHWSIPLTHTCGCGAVHTILAGVAKFSTEGSKPTTPVKPTVNPSTQDIDPETSRLLGECRDDLAVDARRLAAESARLESRETTVADQENLGPTLVLLGLHVVEMRGRNRDKNLGPWKAIAAFVAEDDARAFLLECDLTGASRMLSPANLITRPDDARKTP